MEKSVLIVLEMCTIQWRKSEPLVPCDIQGGQVLSWRSVKVCIFPHCYWGRAHLKWYLKQDASRVKALQRTTHVQCIAKNKADVNVVRYLPAHFSDLLFNSYPNHHLAQDQLLIFYFCDEKRSIIHKPNCHTELPNL